MMVCVTLTVNVSYRETSAVYRIVTFRLLGYLAPTIGAVRTANDVRTGPMTAIIGPT